MPKKYKQKSLLTKPTSSAPSSLSLSRNLDLPDVPPTKTVNDLIRESRQGTSNDRPQTVSTGSSIPPSLRVVLDLPTPPAPAPRLGIRGPTRLRRIPGPPPPRSWLIDSSHAPAEFRNIPWSKAHERTRIQKQSSALPEGNYPSDKSFQHVVMRAMALNWQWHAEYDHEYLSELPLKARQTLLSYVAIYSEGIVQSPLRLLFPPNISLEERNEVRRLDLGNAIGTWTTLKRLEKELEGDKVDQSKLSTALPHDQAIPDAWDESELTDLNGIPSSLVADGVRFHNLKHLSLAVAPDTTGSVASWSGLLSIASKLSTLTSLSLAYWPQPTYTPNASARMDKIRGSQTVSAPSITYGGTNFYSAFDNDWREAAGILRSLSRSLYCLHWLDLTGCGDWFAALTWHPTGGDTSSSLDMTGPDWNGSWRGLEHLVLAVGWTPVPATSPHLDASASSKDTEVTHASNNTDTSLSDVLARLSSARLGAQQDTESLDGLGWNVEAEREKYYHRMEVTRHKAIQTRARDVARALRSVRKEHGGKWINVDFGPSENFEV